MLHGRSAEQSVIDRLLSDARESRSGALLVRGEPGIGKTALLDYAAETAEAIGNTRVIRGTGVEPESELPFAGLHLLLRPVLDRAGALPAQQERALRAAFGLAAAEAGDRLLVGLAVLSLLSELAEDGPLLVLVDDAQWLDRASAEALLFAARRLDAEGIALVLAAREPFTAPGVAELTLGGIDPVAASALLGSVAGGGIDPVVRYRVLAEARGNPLALIELPAALSRAGSPGGRPGDPAGDPAGDTALPLTERVQDAFLDRFRRLPEATQGLLAVAAASGTGGLDVVLPAAATFGDHLEDLHPAESAGLVRVEAGAVVFRHPLVRAAVYQGIPPSLRLAVHRALAEALTGADDADRRAWHLAMAATGPDEEVAAELERTAARASERSGYAAAASAYDRAARLSALPGARARRLTLAAEAAIWAGELDRAGALAEQGARQLAVLAGDAGRTGDADDHGGPGGESREDEGGRSGAGAGTGEGDGSPALRARLTHVRATAGFMRGAPREAYDALLDGAAPVDGARAARMLIQAFHSAWYLGEPEVARVAERLRALTLPPGDPLAPVAGFVTAVLSGSGDLPPLTEVVAEARRAGADSPRDLVQVCGIGLAAGQDAEVGEVARSLVEEARTRGTIGVLPTLLFFSAETELFHGRHRDALTAADEGLRIARDTGQAQWAGQLSAFLAYLAAVEGDDGRCHALVNDALADGVVGTGWTAWALGTLDLGHGRVEAALTRLAPLAGGYQVSETRCVPDLVEAAVRLGDPERAAGPFARYHDWARRTGRPWAHALALRCRALLEDSEECFTAALEAGARPFEQARTELLYGEWLRRTRRKSDARPHLRAALETFERLEAAPWAARARTELGATGSAAPEAPAPGVLARLTPQELQIVRLAAGGLSNRDIAAQLFLSPRTVGYHLYKAYPKLGVASRGELRDIVLFA
ncbi:helix-turn-helix transcriptional regulator [Streptosporangium pseudovulgare]|uniref:LuxR family transcriptional regulator n=1 Tax=Streptosporangium pseudovulgare TaxID=35765 RepID=A0ABQ2QTQ9_9ACTN|nr:AAA family ATPase [Streptosporangium pseudovulgare]GGP97113.1 LuxR family transcriptional regulator [Streptosporangium pseudovulgare]